MGNKTESVYFKAPGNIGKIPFQATSGKFYFVTVDTHQRTPLTLRIKGRKILRKRALSKDFGKRDI